VISVTRLLLALSFAVLSFDVVRAQSTQPSGRASPTTAPADGDFTPPPDVPLPQGMTRIFDGKSLDGWVPLPADSWLVRDGALTSVGDGRGVIYTAKSYERYRIVFDIRHIYGNKDHQACVLVFCTPPVHGEKPLDALGGIQFQPPNGGHWDYRKGQNKAAEDLFTRVNRPKFDPHQWSRVEILVDRAAGTARMAVAQPVGSKAVEVLDFKDPTAGRAGPFALQMHNKGLFDAYANIAVEENPAEMELITTKSPTGAAAALAAPAADDAQAPKDLAQLQGEWQMVSGVANGFAIPEEMTRNFKRVCKDDELTVTNGDQLIMRAKITLDPTKTPKTIDFKVIDGPTKGKTQLGIYELTGDQLKSCFAAPDDPRPTDFDSKSGQERTSTVWKRKPAKE
jgi:uncharacterized protein (TIGR03067 family)